MDKVPCYSLKIRALNDLREYDDAVIMGFKALEELGEKLPIEQDVSFVFNLTEETKVTLMNVSNWISAEKMTNTSALASMQILSDLITSSYFSRSKSVLPLVAIKMVHLTLEHGVSLHSASGFSIFAAILCRNHKNVKYGNHVGNLALLLLQKFPLKESVVTVNLPIYNLVKWCSENVSSCIKPLLNTLKIALETGNHEKTEMSINLYCYIMVLSGKSMACLEHGIDTVVDAQFLNKCIPMATKKMISILVFSETRVPENLIEDMIKDSDSTCHSDNPGRSSGIYLICLIAMTFFHVYDKAMKLIRAKASSFYMPGTYMAVVHEFIVGLVLLSIAKNSSERSKLISDANECIEKLTNWSSICPDNFLNKLTLLKAELSALNGDEFRAVHFYNQSILLAKRSKFIHEEALASEKAAIYLFERKRDSSAHHFLLQAYEAYFQWGATAKMMHLRNLYPSLTANLGSIHRLFSQTTDVPLDICVSTSADSLSQVSDLERSSFSNSKRATKKARTP